MSARPSCASHAKPRRLSTPAIGNSRASYEGMQPGPEGSVMKLGTTDLNLRIQTFAMELLGPYSVLEYRGRGAIDRGKWSHRMLAARRGTIAAGTNEIQHNIIGERVLGLPKG